MLGHWTELRNGVQRRVPPRRTQERCTSGRTSHPVPALLHSLHKSSPFRCSRYLNSLMYCQRLPCTGRTAVLSERYRTRHHDRSVTRPFEALHLPRSTSGSDSLHVNSRSGRGARWTKLCIGVECCSAV